MTAVWRPSAKLSYTRSLAVIVPQDFPWANISSFQFVLKMHCRRAHSLFTISTFWQKDICKSFSVCGWICAMCQEHSIPEMCPFYTWVTKCCFMDPHDGKEPSGHQSRAATPIPGLPASSQQWITWEQHE